MNDFTHSDLTVADKAIWLDGVKTGKQREINRIIKLLEHYYLETQIQVDIRGQIITQSYSVDLIALIKGENK